MDADLKPTGMYSQRALSEAVFFPSQVTISLPQPGAYRQSEESL